MRTPFIMFGFKDTDLGTLAFNSTQYQSALFGATPPFGRPYTLRTYYEQLSNGMFSAQGTAYGWVQLDSNETYYTGPAGGCPGNPYGTNNCNGIWGQGAVAEAVGNAASKVDAGVDFGQFDNDGPDGIANSGDDDGFVDLLILVYPTMDGSCGSNNHLWAHRSSVFPRYTTNDPSASGGSIQIRDYLMQSGLGGGTGCDVTQLMSIGTVSHEFGHGLGLPDLYDLSQVTEGIGDWGLMGGGNWATQDSPARMEAWSLAQLGWVSLQEATSGSYTLTPSATGHTVLVVNPPSNPRSEYFLLENRHPLYSDTAMIRIRCQRSGLASNCDGGGLTVWHVDGISSGNSTYPPLLALVQADGQQDLQNRFNRGDAGDAFPGTAGNTSLGPLTNPNSDLNTGDPSGVELDNISELGDHSISFSVNIQMPPVATQLVLTTEPGGAVSGWSFTEQPVVQLRDANNLPVAQSGVVVTAAIASGSGVLSGFSTASAQAGKGEAGTPKALSALATVTATTDANGVATFINLTITGTGPHTLSFNAPNVTGVTSASFTVAQPAATALQDGVAVPGLAGAIRSTVFYVITLPAGVAQLTVTTSGGSGDADLYVRQGDFPTLTTWGCRPYTTGTAESCQFATPAAGNWYIALQGFASYTGVTLVAEYTAATQLALTTQPGGAVSGWPFTQQPVVELRDANNQPVAQSGVVVTAAIASGSGVLSGFSTASAQAGKGEAGTPKALSALATVTATTDANGVATFINLTITGTGPHTLSFSAANLTGVTSASFTVAQPVATALQNNVAVAGLGGAIRSTVFYVITVPSGAAQLTVSTSGGSGDVDLYVRQGDFPMLGAWDCRPYIDGTTESCQIATPAAGNWYIALQGFADYSGVTLVAQYPAPATQLAVVTQPEGAVSGTPFAQQPVVELRDANNQAVAQSDVVVTAVIATGTGTLSPQPATATTNGQGQAAFTTVAITGTGSHTLGFSAPNLTGATSASFTVSAAPATHLALTTPPGGAVSGAPFTQQPVVELRDANDQPVPQSGVVVTGVILTGPGTLSPQPATATTNGQGQALFTSLAITGAGAHTMGFDSPNLTGVNTASFTVSPAPATQLAVVTQPDGAVSGTPFSQQPVVELRDASNQPVAQGGVVVTAVIATGPGTLSPQPATATTNAQGLAVFTTLAITGTGSYTLGFSALNLTGVSSAGFTVAPAPATQLALTTQPGGAVSGWPFTQQPTVELRDANNQPVAQSGVLVTAAIASGSGVLTGTSTAATQAAKGGGGSPKALSVLATVTATTDANGVATFADLTITGTGSHTLSFSAPNPTGVTSGSFTVAQPAATVLQNNVAVPGLGGATRSTAFYVILLPAGVTQLTVSTSAGSGDVDLYLRQGDFPTLSAWDCRPYTLGTAESCQFATPAAGNWYIALQGFADYSGVTLVAQYTNAATQLAVVTQPGGAVSAVPFTQQPLVALRDVNNQPVAQSGVVVTASIATGTGTLSPQPATATTNGLGQAVFTSLAISGTGSQTLDFTAPGMTKATSQSFTLVGMTGILPCLLGQCQLSSAEIAALDNIGNHNGVFDLGDFLGWLDRTGTAVDARVIGSLQAKERTPRRVGP